MSQQDRLRALFMERFGEDWQKQITLTLRADTLSWFVHLIEVGIEARREQFKKEGFDASAAVSIGSWTMDLEDLVNRIAVAITPNSAKRGKGKRA